MMKIIFLINCYLTNTQVSKQTIFANNFSASIRLSKTQLHKIDEAIHKKLFGSGAMALKISNEEINDIMEMVKLLGNLAY